MNLASLALINDPTSPAECWLSDVLSNKLTEADAVAAATRVSEREAAELDALREQTQAGRQRAVELTAAFNNVQTAHARESDSLFKLRGAAIKNTIAEAVRSPDFSFNHIAPIAESQRNVEWLEMLARETLEQLGVQNVVVLHAEYLEAVQNVRMLSACAEVEALRLLIAALPLARENGQMTVDIYGHGKVGELHRQADAAQDIADSMKRNLGEMTVEKVRVN